VIGEELAVHRAIHRIPLIVGGHALESTQCPLCRRCYVYLRWILRFGGIFCSALAPFESLTFLPEELIDVMATNKLDSLVQDDCSSTTVSWIKECRHASLPSLLCAITTARPRQPLQ
jgi:hypothetical protein